jgi:hypothetical protein
MNLLAYVKLMGTGEMTRLHRASGVSYATIHRIVNDGHLMTSYVAAKRLSAATDGAVSVAELCEGPASKPQKRKKKRGRGRPRDSEAPAV